MSGGTDPEAGAARHRTALHELHMREGARMVPFAGYDMPLHYPPGLLREHLHVRSAAGLFDVSHMGQIALHPHGANMATLAHALETLLPIDVEGLAPGRQRYGFFTNFAGGLLDDLMVAHLGDHFLFIVNAALKAADEAHLRATLSEVCSVTRLDRALIALQGPQAEAALARIAPACRALRFMDVRRLAVIGADCVVARSGYTGEDGFEIAVPTDRALDIAQTLLDDDAVKLAGLGARDSLRLEAGFCLYGADIDAATSPVEAGLGWAIPRVRRRAGAREGGFPGAAQVLEQLAMGAPRHRVGLRPDGRAPVRAGARLHAGPTAAAEPVGRVTSGGYSPSLAAPVAMGYLPTNLATPGGVVFAELRGQRLPMTVCTLPFVRGSLHRS